MILVGENGYGDEFGIGCDEKYSVLDIANMFGGEIKFIPERKGNRMSADVITSKTRSLGWSAKRSIKEYIQNIKNI